MSGLNGFIDGLVSSRGARTVFDNPIYTALVVVLLIMILVYFNFRTIVDEDEPFGRTMVRFGIYTAIGVTTVIYLHYRYFEARYDEKYENASTQRLVDGARIGGELEIPEAERVDNPEPPVGEVKKPVPGTTGGALTILQPRQTFRQ